MKKYHANNFNAELRVMDKCTLCDQLREKGETPACVWNCAGGALHYGDINDPENEVSKLLAANEGNSDSNLDLQEGYELVKNYVDSISVDDLYQ